MDEKLMRHGAFGWFELMTTDISAARKFYNALFNWSYQDMPMESMDYTVINLDGDDVAGITSMPPDTGQMPPTWGIYITVNDADKTVEKAKSMGGKVLVEPTDIPKIGRFSVLQDPQGAWFAVISYQS